MIGGHAAMLKKPYQEVQYLQSYLAKVKIFSTQIIDLQKKYGPILRFDYNVPTIFIGDYDLALEACKGDACNSRPMSATPGFTSTFDKVCHECQK